MRCSTLDAHLYCLCKHMHKLPPPTNHPHNPHRLEIALRWSELSARAFRRNVNVNDTTHTHTHGCVLPLLRFCLRRLSADEPIYEGTIYIPRAFSLVYICISSCFPCSPRTFPCSPIMFTIPSSQRCVFADLYILYAPHAERCANQRCVFDSRTDYHDE